MKKLWSCVLVLAIVLALSSCGGNMSGWATMELNVEIENYDEVCLQYTRLPLGSSSDEVHFYGTSTEREVIDDLYDTINGLPYRQKTTKAIDTGAYWEKLIIQFKSADDVYTLTFYSYGVTKGYFVFDDGEIHQYRGDFVSLTYSEFQDKLTPQPNTEN